ncbi:MAG: EamA family transporter [Saprospiraceae bacterium]|nr:EamA family transporter [Saprospiraceae bacterium]
MAGFIYHHSVYVFLSTRNEISTTGMDFLYLILLSYVCTVVSYVLALKSLHHLSAFSSMLAFNLEPIYGIILAILVFSEHKEFNTYFYIGATILILSVFLHRFYRKMESKTIPGN